MKIRQYNSAKGISHNACLILYTVHLYSIAWYCVVLHCVVFISTVPCISVIWVLRQMIITHIQISIQISSIHLVSYLLDGYNFSFPVLSSLRPLQIYVNSCSLTQFVFIALKIQYIIENAFGNMFYIL